MRTLEHKIFIKEICKIKEALHAEILAELEKRNGKIVICNDKKESFSNYRIFDGDDKYLEVCAMSIYKDENDDVILSYCDSWGFNEDEIALDYTNPSVEDLLNLIAAIPDIGEK